METAQNRRLGRPVDREARNFPRSCKISEWTERDQLGWGKACQSGERLRRGGAASHLCANSRADIARRYGLFVDFLQRANLFDPTKGAESLVTPENVGPFLVELQARVRSVTVWNSIYKLRRAAELIAPSFDFAWLAEIEKDIALVMESKSKAGRLVLTERLVEAGLLLVKEAELFGKTAHARAIGVRNGLMIVLLALHPIRIKNFASLTIGETLIDVAGRWWLRVPADETKAKHTEHRRVPDYVVDLVNSYIELHRPALIRERSTALALWISSTTGQPMTQKNLGTLISKITRGSLGVDVSPHLFRHAAASTAAIHGGDCHNLATALLNQRDPRVYERHYNYSMSLCAGDEYARLADMYRR